MSYAVDMAKENTPLVSIIMAAYNAEKFLPDSIASVIDQTYSNWELLIVNDCSSDRTKEVAESFNDPRIKLINLSENGGAGVARNMGLKSALGSYIAFLDADDLWLPHKLETQLNFMLETRAPICHTSYAFINETGESIAGYVEASPEVDLHKYMRCTEIGLSTAMINKKIIGDFVFNSMRLRQDTRLWIELLKKNYHAYGLNKNLVKYRIREGQISGNKFKSAQRTFKLYLSFKEIPLFWRLFNFSCYLVNAIAKRLVRHT